MAPTRNHKHLKGVDNQKPTALATVAKANRVLPKYSHGRRSSLRLAIQESLRDSSGVVAATIRPSNPSASQLSPPPFPLSALQPTANTTQRRSMRQALKKSLHVNTSTAADITDPVTPSSTPSPSPYSTANSSSTPSTPSTVATTPRTPATPFSASPFAAISTPSKASRTSTLRPNRRQYQVEDDEDDSDNFDDGSSDHDSDSDSDYEGQDENGQYARVDDTDRPHANGINTPFKGWYRIRNIVTETRSRNGGLIYLVDWEGVDPRTGVSWPSSWVEAKNVSVAAIRAWDNLKSRESNMTA